MQAQIAVMQALANGEDIECQISPNGTWDLWRIETEPSWDWSKFNYRIARKPKLRPWKPEEVPVGGVLKKKNTSFVYHYNVDLNNGVTWFTSPSGETRILSIGELVDSFVVSTDHGKTWLPCGVME